MPNLPKKFLSKAERITRAQLPQASQEARIAGKNLRIMAADPARFRSLAGIQDLLSQGKKVESYSNLLTQQTPSQKRGSSRPSSRAKKLLKEGSKKFVGPRTPDSLNSENIDAIDGKYDPYRGYKKRDRRADEIEEARVFKKNPIGSVKLAVSDRIGRAKGLLLAPPGANRGTERARASELIKAARKLTDPKTRAKVLRVIQEELGSYRKRTGSRDEEIPF